MKKYAFILFVFILFIFKINSANALTAGCTPDGPYNITTGELCPTPIVLDPNGPNRPPKFSSFSTIPSSIAAGQSVSFTWSATDVNNDDLLWGADWGDTTSPSASVICPSFTTTGTGENWTHTDSHTWASAGSYNVTIFVSDCRGPTTKKTFTVNVGPGTTNTQVSLSGIPPVIFPHTTTTTATNGCVLTSAPIPFEPHPQGVPRPQLLSSGFSTFLTLFQNGVDGARRVLMGEAFGYSVLDISNPLNPVALYYHDTRFPIRPLGSTGPSHSVTTGGDGQSNVAGIAVSPDGQRIFLGMSGVSELWGAVFGESSGGPNFILEGSDNSSGERPGSGAVQKINGRYIAYYVNVSELKATDITTLPQDSLEQSNVSSATETSKTLPSGQSLRMIGNYLVYLGGDGSDSLPIGAYVIDASNPGPIGSIMTGMPHTVLTNADFGVPSSAQLMAINGTVDPADPNKIWIIGSFSQQSGVFPNTVFNNIYSLVSVTKNFTKVLAGPAWQVPVLPGEVNGQGNFSFSIVPSNGNLFILMWSRRSKLNGVFNELNRLYTTTVSAWPNVNTTAPPNVIAMDPTPIQSFGIGKVESFSSGNNVYVYDAAGPSAFVIPLSCGTEAVPFQSPAAPPVTPPPASPGPVNYSCATGASLGLPECTGGCYIAQPGPSGRSAAESFKCVLIASTLRLDSRGSEVVALQNFLNSRGYDAGTADGVFGPKTKAAVVAFQLANSLTGDGVVGPVTRGLIK